MRNMDVFRMEFRQHFIISLVNTIILSVCMALIYVIPKWTNVFVFYNPSNIDEGEVLIFKILFATANALLIISWILASAFNKASIGDMDLDPEDLDDPERLDTTDE